jgi:hypothetical protein
MSAFSRWLPASGLVAVIGLALTGIISPPPPVAGAPAAEILAYYARHNVGLEIESVADGVGAMFFVIFAATLHARVRTMPSLTAFVAAGIFAACAFVQVAAFHTLAFRSNPDPGRAALLNDLQSFMFQVTTFPTLLFLSSVAAAILTSRALPRWLGLAALAAALLQVAAWISFFAPPGILAAGALPDILAFAGLLAWLVLCSSLMLIEGWRGRSNTA